MSYQQVKDKPSQKISILNNEKDQNKQVKNEIDKIEQVTKTNTPSRTIDEQQNYRRQFLNKSADSSQIKSTSKSPNRGVLLDQSGRLSDLSGGPSQKSQIKQILEMRQQRTNDVKQRRSVIDTMAFKKNVQKAQAIVNTLGDHFNNQVQQQMLIQQQNEIKNPFDIAQNFQTENSGNQQRRKSGLFDRASGSSPNGKEALTYQSAQNFNQISSMYDANSSFLQLQKRKSLLDDIGKALVSQAKKGAQGPDKNATLTITSSIPKLNWEKNKVDYNKEQSPYLKIQKTPDASSPIPRKSGINVTGNKSQKSPFFVINSLTASEKNIVSVSQSLTNSKLEGDQEINKDNLINFQSQFQSPKNLWQTIANKANKLNPIKSTGNLVDYGVDRFSENRSKSIAYIDNPTQGNLGLYMKHTRMNVIKENEQERRKSIIGSGNKEVDNQSVQQLRRGKTTASLVDLQSNKIKNAVSQSQYMAVHDAKISKILGYDEKQNTLGRYLQLKNKTGLTYLKPEIEGLHQEKEQAVLVLQDQKKKLIYDKEDLTILQMQNKEYRRQIGEIMIDNEEVKNKQIECRYAIDQVYNELFIKNDTMKLYSKTIIDLRKALATEQACCVSLQTQIKTLRELLNEEQIQRDDLKQFQFLQRKQISNLRIKHDRRTEILEQNLTVMNDHINDAIKKGYVSVKQLERKTKNIVAAQQSQFFMSKYTASKLLTSKNSFLDQSRISKLEKNRESNAGPRSSTNEAKTKSNLFGNNESNNASFVFNRTMVHENNYNNDDQPHFGLKQ